MGRRDLEPSCTLVDRLGLHAIATPKRSAYRFLDANGDEYAVLSYAELERRAWALAEELRRRVPQGSRVLLALPLGPELVLALFGCFCGGFVPVCAPPARRARGRSLAALIADADPALIVATDAGSTGLAQLAEARGSELCAPEVLLTSVEPSTHSALPRPRPDDVALLQYTSGSLRAPRGVSISHAALFANQCMIQSAFGLDSMTRVVGWLPPFHDMGLIGNVLQPVFVGGEAVLMSSDVFAKRPLLWLEAISRYGANTSGGPDFAYGACVRLAEEAKRSRLSLESWKVAFNGAEPVRVRTLERFAAAFAAFGFDRRAFLACYGLAEATLFVSSGVKGEGPSIRRVDASALACGRALEASASDLAALELVACGRAVPPGQITIVDPVTRRRVSDGDVGEIWVSGPHLASGYWRLDSDAFGAQIPDSDARYLRSGDLGFLLGGDLFVTGRLDDAIAIRGKKYHPEDIEETARCCDVRLEGLGGAAFVHTSDSQPDAEMVIVHEIGTEPGVELDEVVSRIQGATVGVHQIPTPRVLLVRRGSLPRTTSGKIRRRATAEAYSSGRLREIAHGRGRSERKSHSPFESTRASLLDRVAALKGVARETIPSDGPINALGLDSLRVSELVAWARATFSVELSLAQVLAGASVDEIARAIVSGEAALPRVPVPDERPATVAEQGLWLLQRRAPESGALNLGVVLVCDGEQRLQRALRALELLIERHAALRTNFYEIDGQVFAHTRRARVSVSHEQARDAEAAQAALERCLRRPFDLSREMPARIHIVTRAGRHEILLCVHHVAADFPSFVTLAGDLLAYDDALSRGEPPPQPRAASARQLDTRRWASDAAYFRATLDGVGELRLPYDRPRPPIFDEDGGAIAFEFESELAAIRMLCTAHGTTPFVFVLSAYLLLLHRWSGQGDVVVGTSSNGAADEQQSGYRVNALALRSRLDHECSFAEFMLRTRTVVVEALAHGSLPFVRLVQELGIQAQLGKQPLFDAVLVWLQTTSSIDPKLAALGLPARGDRIRHDSLELAGVQEERPPTRYDVHLTVADVGNELWATLQYPRALFDRQTMQAFAGQLREIVVAALATPERSCSELALPPPIDTAAELDVEPAQAEGASTVLALFEAQVASGPDRIAVVAADRTLSYADLARAAEQVALDLRKRGVRKGDTVALLLPTGAAYVIALWGVVKAGAAFVCIDPDMPVARSAAILRACRPIRLLSESDVGAVLGDRNVVASEAPAEAILSPDDLAYVAFTSGSTGEPKPIAHVQRTLAQFVAWQQATFDLGPGGRMAGLAPPGFDVAYCEIFGALCFGATLVLPKSRALPPEAMSAWLRAEGITHLQVVPSYFRLLYGLAGGDLSALRHVLLVGETVPVPLARELSARSAATRFWNVYGPTEVVAATFHEITAPDAQRASIPIGRAIAGRRLLIVDSANRPCPIGVMGEIAVLSRHVFGRPSRSLRLYRTGDLGRRRADGNFDFCGRRDNQLKLRGVRVELEEIEAALRRCAGVSDCVVARIEDRDSETRLVALFEGPAEEIELRRRARAALPLTFVPARFIRVEELPRGRTGKLDRSAATRIAVTLASHPSDAPNADSDAPNGELERELGRIWSALLPARSFGRHDDFFAMGGHSLQAMQLLSRAQELAGVELRLVEFMREPTIAALAALVENVKRRENPSAADVRALVEYLGQLDDSTALSMLGRAPADPQEE